MTYQARTHRLSEMTRLWGGVCLREKATQRNLKVTANARFDREGRNEDR